MNGVLLRNSQQLHAAILCGSYRVALRQQELNAANGFPVPDQDTGSNLAHMFGGIRSQLMPGETIAGTLNRLADIALRHARGNSGAIFSQFFNGMYQAGKALKDALSVQDACRLFASGDRHARRAVQRPCEGTILTAIRSYSQSFEMAMQKEEGASVYDAALDALRRTVAQTRDQLPQQKALQQPDAGALAFLYFMEGLVDCLVRDLSTRDMPALPVLPLPADAHQVPAHDLPYRFCTEVLIEKPASEALQAKVQAALEVMGDSLVVSETDALLRAHIHSNAPDRVVDALEGFGNVLEVKADDMRQQQALAGDCAGHTALVIDSIADVPDTLLPAHVHRVPLVLLADGVAYQDKRTMSPGRLKRRRAGISSSQLNLAELGAFLDPILARYDSLLIVCVSARMSGLYARYQEYIALHPGREIHLVDSRLNSAAEGLLALRAAQMLDGGMAAGDAARALEHLRQRIRIYVSVPDLSAMVASGRLNRRIGKALMALRYLPLISIDRQGAGSITGLTFSQQANQALLLRKLGALDVEAYAAVYAGDDRRLQAALPAIRGALRQEPLYLSDISSVVSLFAGEGAYAVALLLKEA